MARDSQAIERRQFVKGLAVGSTSLALAGCLGDGNDGGNGNGGGDGDGDGDGMDDGDGDGDGDGMDDGGPSGTIKFIHPGYFGADAEDLIPMFNDRMDDLTADPQATPAESASTRKYYVNQFAAQSSDFDVGMMDVVWPAEFVANEWAAEVEDPDNLTDQMLSTPVDAVTIDDSLYGMPIFTDANALYYRSDMLDKYDYDPPSTYMELVNQAQEILSKEDEITNGYIWQGGANEGLTIMWLNTLWGWGGSVNQGGSLTVNTDTGVQALAHLRDLIHDYEVVPKSIPSSSTDQNRKTFQQGNTLFMRNWPYAVALMNEDGSAVQDKFDVTMLPRHEDHQDADNSCLGGWNIFINAFSENKPAAQEFAQFMASKEAQENMALEHSRLPVRADIYEEEYTDQADHLAIFGDILERTSARPATAKYSTFSEHVYTECNKALVQDKSPQQALDDAQNKIDRDVN